MYLSLYTSSLLNSWDYFFNISLSLTKRIMYLLLLSKYLTYAFIWRSFIHNGDGKALPLCLYPVKYLNESSIYDFLWDDTISSISASLILMGFIFLWKALLMMPFSPLYTASCSKSYTMKKKSQNIYFNFLVSR